jgi:hypothetical protein
MNARRKTKIKTPIRNPMENLYMPGCVRTWSGQYLNITEPATTTIYPIDIATQLARICRFGGATKEWYSVAEHSVWGALKAEEIYPGNTSLPFKFLLHDAHEYVLHDISSPVKKKLPGYLKMAAVVQDAINVRFRSYVDQADRQKIDHIDELALHWEWENKVLRWTGMELSIDAARDYYMHHFKRLCKSPFVIHP